MVAQGVAQYPIGLLKRLSSLRHVVGLWRAPEQIAASPEWSGDGAQLTDVYLFGEVGLFGARRTDDGNPSPILPGPRGAPQGIAGSSVRGFCRLFSQAKRQLSRPIPNSQRM